MSVLELYNALAIYLVLLAGNFLFFGFFEVADPYGAVRLHPFLRNWCVTRVCNRKPGKTQRNLHSHDAYRVASNPLHLGRILHR